MSENRITISLRERGWLDTDVFQAGQTSAPGKTLFISVNPLSAFVADMEQTTPTVVEPPSGIAGYSSNAALVLGRFMRFRYVGTKISLVPAAAQSSVDPAHINEDANVANSMNPKDIGNLIHWKRWLGSRVALPYVHATGSGSPKKYTLTDAYDLDAAWMSADSFQHTPITDGFSIVVKPKVSTATISAAVSQSVFGFKDASSLSYSAGGDAASSAGLRASSDITEEGWLPNPLAGLTYTIKPDSVKTGAERCYITGVNTNYPWFSDAFPELSATDIIALIKRRYLYPACIIRLPPAYSSKFYWTVYIRHLLEFDDPYIVTSSFPAANIQPYVPGPNAIETGNYHYRPLSCDDIPANSAESYEDIMCKYRIQVLHEPDPFYLSANSAYVDFDGMNFSEECGSFDPFAALDAIYAPKTGIIASVQDGESKTVQDDESDSVETKTNSKKNKTVESVNKKKPAMV